MRQRGFDNPLDARVNRQHDPVAALGRFVADLGDFDAARIDANCVAARCAAQVTVKRVFDPLLAGAVRLVIIKIFDFLVFGLLGAPAEAEQVRGQRAIRVLADRRDEQIRARPVAGAFNKCGNRLRRQVAPKR